MQERGADGGRTARHLRVSGRVQGVFFRDSTRSQADRRGVTGWVRNCPDGTVEAWLEGARDAVDEVEAWVRSGGPRAARVQHVEASVREPAGYERFEVQG